MDDPYGDEEERLNSSRIFHTLLIGREDSTALQTSQENSIITEDIEEDFEIFKKELSDQSDERGNDSPIMEHQFTEATQKVNLKKNIQSVHEDIEYQCSQCDYQATRKDNLKTHIQSVHEGIKYPCTQCDYQATREDSLKTHIQSVHEGIKYPCTQCDYQATTKGHLKRHIQSVH